MARGLHVVGGEARGVPLVAPKGARPTTGRVREALFSSLGDVAGASVLDLYAGSGALAIEALSRGAARALLVDDDAAAVDACNTNLGATRLGDRGRVRRGAVGSFLRGPVPVEAPFDLVLADPPYGADDELMTGVLEALEAPGWLAPGARVVVERAARDPLRSLGSAWTLGWQRKYGDTLVTVLRASS